jgi:predicted TIM-barrel fold metal-dependent hydrolase
VSSLPFRFTCLADLARLPWFSIRDGRLVVKDASIGPIADMHTHLALAYVRPMSVDLEKLHDETKHYLPTCCPVDLSIYANRNIPPEALRELKIDLTLRSMGKRGMRATHTVPNLVREMDEMGIRQSLLLPIDFPVLSQNAGVALGAAKKEPKLLSLGSVHPYAADPERRLDSQLALGARGIKMHPAVQLVRPDSPRAQSLYRMCGARDMFVLWHCGPVGIEGRYPRHLSQVRHYLKPIVENPRTRFVLGHSGALQFDQALELQRRYPNVWLETSSQSLANVEEMVRRADPDRVVHGSDWPFYHPAMSISKILIATEGRPEIRHKFLWSNAAALLGLEGQQRLERRAS